MPYKQPVDYSGHRYGKLTAIEPVGKQGRDYRWRCRCDCGNETVVRSGNLSKTRSCGCSRYDLLPPAEIIGRNRVLRTYQKSAVKRGYEWNLDVSEFTELISRDCYYCGSPPNAVRQTGAGDFLYNGLDRLDNNKGYDLGNVVPCCWTCNSAKKGLSYDEFRKWIFRVAEHQKQWGF